MIVSLHSPIVLSTAVHDRAITVVLIPIIYTNLETNAVVKPLMIQRMRMIHRSFEVSTQSTDVGLLQRVESVLTHRSCHSNLVE
ncbi:hypothetical protein TNIN_225691 [Trichonephila inaurata madagascariensis]|uniref:Uncharacterized protein n=1 Tax=Trichonephila inaurata madagascariensis TaxID=2747483 RepID=A0A8X6Y8H9_9ARAC|nr:hypothetical protein TNIN_225691 [Trichonephila inaurata madagascariensis]